MADVFRWLAIYADGSTLPEIEDDGAAHGFAEVDLGRLASFALCPQREGLPSPVLRAAGDGARPIFFRRRTISLDPTTGSEGGRTTITVLGWQRTVQGRSVKAFTAFYDDGSVLISDRDDF